MSASFTPTAAELALVQAIFSIADPKKLGVVTGEAAVKVFGGAKLAPAVLGEIWAIADNENNGFLSRKGVAIAARLIGHAQQGKSVSESLIDTPGPVARIEGLPNVSTPASPNPSSVPRSPPPPTSNIPSSIPPLPQLSAQDKAKLTKIFASCGPKNGLLTGGQARDVFVRSKLPVDKLSQIWTLADTQDRGSLDQGDFIVAMYLIQGSMNGQIPTIPSALPPWLYDQAGAKSPPLVTQTTGLAGIATHGTGQAAPLTANLTGLPAPSSVFQPVVPIRQQTTGQAFRQPPPAPFRPPAAAPAFASPFPQAQAWDVTVEEKAKSDDFFDQLDTQKKGYIEGEAAVNFLLLSQLSGDILAQVWDLSDMNNDGRLTREGFAVAMHLIWGKLNGKDIPATLPESLIPPAMRGKIPAAAAPAPAPPAPVQDLLWDDFPSSSSPTQSPNTSIFQPQTTGFSATLQPQSTGQFSLQQPSILQQHSGQASLGRQITGQATDPFGGSAAPSPGIHLLDDDDGAAVSKIADNAAEIGNVQNQFSSTSRSLETTKTERTSIEQTIASQASQLTALQTQLASAKAAYETETRLLGTLRDRLNTQTADIQKTREELIRSESDLSGIRVEKAEIEGNLLRDKEEIRELQRRMREVGEEVEKSKVDVEKAKKDAKQQKGLLAIAKKQLSTREAERAKIAKELEEARAEAEAATREREAAEAELAAAELAAESEAVPPLVLANGFAPAPTPPRTDTPSFAAAQPLPISPSMTGTSSVLSPASWKSSNNPFERLALSSSNPSTPRSASPFQQLPGVVPTPPPSEPASVPAPVENVVGEDPFGFNDFVAKDEPAAPVPLERTSTDQPEVGPMSPDSSRDIDETDSMFGTPPSTATGMHHDTSPRAKSPEQKPAEPAREDSLQSTANAQFPALDEKTPTSTPFGAFEDEHTDLNLDLKEKEEDSDSDSNSDDEKPLEEVKASIAKGKAPADLTSSSTSAATAATDASNLTAMTNGVTSQTSGSMTSAFDDAFGGSTTSADVKSIPSPFPPSSGFTSPTASQITQQTTTEVPDIFADVPASSEPASQGNGLAQEATPAVGLSAFDEAMTGLKPEANTQAPVQFSSKFEDDFFGFTPVSDDTLTPPVPEQKPSVPMLPSINGAASPPKPVDGGFDSIFTPAAQALSETTSKQDPWPSATAAPPAQASPHVQFDDAFKVSPTSTPAAAIKKPSDISFDEAFGGAENASRALSFDSTFTAPTTPPANGQRVASVSSQKFPTTTSPPASPGASSISQRRSKSPAPRPASPPPRVASPTMMRPSTASSESGMAPKSEKPQSRHSKLSIRLPFGKRDKKKRSKDELPSAPPVPPPATFLSPVAEPAGPGATTPAVEDDVEPVKQLCGMGFSRTQAVTALEKHGYDVQRALNSLLGAQ